MVVAPIFVPHEIVAHFHLGAQAQIDSLHATKGIEVDPELRFGDSDPVATHIVVIPAVDKSRERTETSGKSDAPHGSGLKAVESTVPGMLTLEIILIHRLE